MNEVELYLINEGVNNGSVTITESTIETDNIFEL